MCVHKIKIDLASNFTHMVEVTLIRGDLDEAWGLDCGQRDDGEGVWIKSVVEGSAATGLLYANDHIVGIDGRSIENLLFTEAIELFSFAGLEIRVKVESVELERYAEEVAPRLWRLKSDCSPRRARPTGLEGLREGGRPRVWDLGGHDLPLTCPYETCGWPTVGRLPCLSFVVWMACNVGAWLRNEKRNVAVLCDSSGARLPLNLACVAVLRIGGRLVGSEIDDSALESYERLAQADLGLKQLPPSFRRWLGNVDVAVLSRVPPNPHPLVIIGIEILTREDFEVEKPALEILDRSNSSLVQPSKRRDDDDSRKLVAYCAVVVQDEFSVTLRSGRGSRIARFSASTAFLSQGEPRLPKNALDLYPSWEHKLPDDFILLLRLATAASHPKPNDEPKKDATAVTSPQKKVGGHRRRRRSATTPPTAPIKYLVPPTDEALLALGNRKKNPTNS